MLRMYPVFILFLSTNLSVTDMAKDLKVDLHVHTSHSSDSRASPESVVKHALELGLDAIAVTDHGTVSGSLEAGRLARKTRLVVIPGQEVLTREGELIILGIRSDIPGMMSALETARQAREEGGFIMVPHPFDIMRRGMGKAITTMLGYIDAIEVFNARTIFGRFNEKALSFAEAHGVPMVVGSDSHFPEEMGSAYMLVRSERDAHAILRAVRSGRAEPFVRRQGMKPRIRRGLLKIRTYF
jgi:predicted metal-dependent phosphoesterase TrpH